MSCRSKKDAKEQIPHPSFENLSCYDTESTICRLSANNTLNSIGPLLESIGVEINANL